MMKKYWIKWALGIASLTLLDACKATIEDQPLDPGTADFSSYVSLGNSLTAGFSDGAMYGEAQTNSYPAIIAKQMMSAKGGNFKQPMVPNGVGLASDMKSGKLTLVKTTSGLFPNPTPNGDLNVLTSVSSKGPFNNVAVPGARSFHVNYAGYGDPAGMATRTANPYFVRFASKPDASMVSDALLSNPTFFSLWIGNNDVLGYASAGGVGDAITPLATFSASVDATVAKMKAHNPKIKGAVANIPDILGAPYFSLIAWNRVEVTAAQAGQINAGLGAQVEANVKAQVTAGVKAQVTAGVTATVRASVEPQVTAGVKATYKAAMIATGKSDSEAETLAAAYILSTEGLAAIKAQTDAQMASSTVQATIATNVTAQMASANVLATITSLTASNFAALKASPYYPVFKEGKNGFLVQDAASPLGFRSAKAGEYITMAFLPVLASLAPEQVPVFIIENKYFLDAAEVKAVNDARLAYNTKLKELATTNGLAFVDIAAFFAQVQKGWTYNGVKYSAAYVSGGAFSIDGLHLTQRGASFIANEFIKSINSTYGATIPMSNVNDYETLRLPN